MRIAITGARGFVARNLIVRLREAGHTDVAAISHDVDSAEMEAALTGAELVFHLSGVNRPQNAEEFKTGNAGFTAQLCAALAKVAPQAAIVFSSSTQAKLDNPYGRSKLEAEEILMAHGARTGAKISIFRLTNIFGKWSRPNYNSAVATFCYNVARGLSIRIDNPQAPLKLIYIDDVVDCFLSLLDPAKRITGFVSAGPEYETTVGEVSDIIRSFRASRDTLTTLPVGKGMLRALYSTYVASLEPASFAYDLPMYVDPRGTFAEMLKTPDCGQFSYFTAHPGVTRGEHYHHSKTEKFLVIKGDAHFGFRHIETGETHEIVTNGEKAQIVETVPGWTHNITNIGQDEMIVMLWANEVFDREHPDTIGLKVAQ
jgi:UDP-2-acetamido-2,6-beta-L-arabino-hexul-4-ose reductase